MSLSPTRTPGTAGAERIMSDASYVDWAAILSGAIVAYALLIVLTTFGAGIGLSMVSPEAGEGVSMRWVVISGGLWLIWTSVSSFAAGGYLAGRMRRRVGDATADEVETRDGGHGVVVWAVGTVLAILMATSGAFNVVGSSVSALGSGASTITSAMEGPLDTAARTALRSDDGTVVADADVRDEISSVLMRSLQDGEVTEEDRSYLATVIANSTEMSQEDAREQIDASIAEVEQTYEQAVDTAEQARIAGVISAFVLAATLLASGGAAYFAAAAGGHHRDENLSFRTFGR